MKMATTLIVQNFLDVKLNFIQIRSKGSHRVYRLAEIRVVVPFHPGKILHPKIIRQVFAAIKPTENDITDDIISDESDQPIDE